MAVFPGRPLLRTNFIVNFLRAPNRFYAHGMAGAGGAVDFWAGSRHGGGGAAADWPADRPPGVTARPLTVVPRRRYQAGMTLARAAALPIPRPKGPAAPAVIDLMPVGAVVPIDGRRPWRLDDPEAVIHRTGTPFAIDFDHQMDKPGATAPAAGWVTGLNAEDGMLRATVEWTPTGARALADRDYRFISPTFRFRSGNREVLALVGGALTNRPALDLPALASRMETRMTDHDPAAAGRADDGLPAPAAPADPPPAPDTAPDSTAALAAAVQAEAPAEAAPPAGYVPMAQYEALAARVAAVETARATERATAAVDGAIAAGRLIPAQRDWALAYCAADPDGFAAFAAVSPALPGPAITARPAGDGMTATEIAVCRAMGVARKAYLAARAAADDGGE